MLSRVIDWSLRHRLLVILIVGTAAVGGGYALGQLNIDAFPDTTPVQVQINTTAPALSPEEVERQVTFPIEQVISGLPGLQQLRSVSKFGFSQIVVIFEDGMDIYFVRQLLNERLATVALPAGIERPRLGPVATGLGEIFHYMLKYKNVDASKLSPDERQRRLTELRTLHDWIIKPQLRSVAGVAEVNSWGGYEKQYHVIVDPNRLIKYRLVFDDIVEALKKNNRNVGGGYIRSNSEALLVHGVGRTVTEKQIGDIVVAAKDGVPVFIRDIGTVRIGHAIRRGTVTFNGRGEAVLGLGFMLMGENSHTVTRSLKAKLEEIKPSLPPEVEIVTVYDRTELVDHVIETVRKNLFEGGLFVIAVLFLFLGNLRAAMIVALAIPLSMLFAFAGMWRFGIAASLLSLGAIDFGMVVDSSVVMVENCVRRLQKRDGADKLAIIRDAAVEVRRPTMFGELIIMIVYLPILTLEGVEGKLFRPMALTVLFALAGSLVLSLTLMPVLASLVIPRHVKEQEPLLMRLAHAIHNPILAFCMRNRAVVLGLALALVAVAFGMVAPNLGAQFIPRLSEGAIAINAVRLAGTSLDESIRLNTQIERVLLDSFPDEIRYVWSRTGTAEIATDPMGIEVTDIFISLKPRDEWTKAETQEELVKQMQQALRDSPGQKLSFLQPIEMRINEMISGIRSDIGIKIFGDDLEVLRKKGAEIESILKGIPGAADVAVEQITGQPVLQIKVKQDQLARYGIPAQAVLELVESMGTLIVGDIYEGQLRFPLAVRLAEPYSTNVEAVGSVYLSSASGQTIPLRELADIRVVFGPSTITREWYMRRIVVSCNVRGRDMVSFGEEAKRKIAENVTFPSARYRVEYGGQFEHYESARGRLMIVVPLALGLILVLLFVTYHNVLDSLRVVTGVPLGWVGGIFALWLRGMPFSISAAIGFIAMSGVAVLDDMILVSYIRQLRRKGMPRDEAVRAAAVTRLRPVLMTTLVASLGFLPMALSTGVGAEVQRPLATVVIGGVISAMLMSLLVIRLLYLIFDRMGNLVARLLTACFKLRRDQLNWLLGEQFQGEGEAH